MNPIYFDHAATTPYHPDALAVYVETARGGPGNASSQHASGRAARAIVTSARDRIAALLGCGPGELVFTSGGTESDNTALFGAARAQRERGRTGIVVSAIEHHAVLRACEKLEQEGFRLTVLPVDRFGRVSVEDAERAIGPETAVVTVMSGNNEVGTLQPVEEIGRLARAQGAVMHTDAVQTLGYVRQRLAELPIDLASYSAHKIGGPQGVGALYVRKGTPFAPLLHGGSQERSRRAGTENTAGVAAFAKALELAVSTLETRARDAERVRAALLAALEAELGPEAFAVNGDPDPRGRLPHIVNVSFRDMTAETLLMNLDLAGVAASSGSACNSGSLQPSHVLAAMGLPESRVASSVRFSFGLGNTTEEAEKTAKIIATIAARLRK